MSTSRDQSLTRALADAGATSVFMYTAFLLFDMIGGSLLVRPKRAPRSGSRAGAAARSYSGAGGYGARQRACWSRARAAGSQQLRLCVRLSRYRSHPRRFADLWPATLLDCPCM